jgi:dehydrodolichyl diphosphate syntase complex subunit NUS1
MSRSTAEGVRNRSSAPKSAEKAVPPPVDNTNRGPPAGFWGIAFKSCLKVLYLIYGVYLLVKSVYYDLVRRSQKLASYHNRTPQLIRQDVAHFDKLPRHIAFILNLKDETETGGGIDGLLDQASEVVSWSAGAGINIITVYERTGALKELPITEVHRAVSKKLALYFGVDARPTVEIVVPHTAQRFANGKTGEQADLRVALLSEEDGRESIVELSKTLADLAANGKLSSNDITLDVIDMEMRSLVSEEPDLLVLFTPHVQLQGFPPWQIRLTEIYHYPMNDEVSYVVFYKALESFANCKINVGR